MTFLSAFILLTVGGALGFLTAALACAASRADQHIEAQHAQPPTQDWEEHA